MRLVSNRKVHKYVVICLLLSVISLTLEATIIARSRVSNVTLDDWESDDFREQCLSQEVLSQLQQLPSSQFLKTLTITMLMENYFPNRLWRDDHFLQCYKEEEYSRMHDAYKAIWEDVEFFPVAYEGDFTYQDTWLASREYGGQRLHEGCDIFGEENIRDHYPIVSMTDGVVEQVGWLPLGGYRIGIRGASGGYYYYAHLSSYDRKYFPGDRVMAGDILGYMGDSGYGQEGTTGKFPVHLHLGIYIQTTNYEELSVNPYWILKYTEKNKIKYAY